jgi:hypothetical protein
MNFLNKRSGSKKDGSLKIQKEKRIIYYNCDLNTNEKGHTLFLAYALFSFTGCATVISKQFFDRDLDG